MSGYVNAADENPVHKVVVQTIGYIISNTHNVVSFTETICSPIPSSFRMNITCSSRSLVYGTSCIFGCDQGYPLIGPTSAVCDRADDQSGIGFWTYNNGTDVPICQRECATQVTLCLT